MGVTYSPEPGAVRSLPARAFRPDAVHTRAAGDLESVAGCILIVLGLGLAGCQAPVAPPEPTPARQDPIDDHEGPILDTTPITAPQSVQQPILIEASASDPSEVYTVILHFKPQNTDWQSMRMTLAEDGIFRAELEADQLYGASSVSYYLEAADGTAYHNTSYSPSSGAESPYKFNLVY